MAEMSDYSLGSDQTLPELTINSFTALPVNPKIKLPHSLEESWKLIEYPTSISDSDTDMSSYVAIHPQSQRSRRSSRCSLKTFNTMPFEQTRYQIETIQMCLLRPDLRTSWGVTLVEHYVKFQGNTPGLLHEVYSELVVDLEDNGIFEKAKIQCGDLIVGINGIDITRCSHIDVEGELQSTLEVDLTFIPNKEQSIKYLLFLDLLQSDLQYLWSLNNLVTLHICSAKVPDGVVHLENITCKSVLQELAVTKCGVQSIAHIIGLSGFRCLKRLNLNNNRLTQLDPDTILKLQCLEEVRLGNNLIETFPLVLTQLPELKDISLVYNLISQIPPEITRMTKLRNLHMDNNYLSDMPHYITHQVPQLKGLTFSSNQLTWHEADMKEFFHLNLIDFTENGSRPRSAGLDNFSGTVFSRATLRRKPKNKEKSLLRKALSA